MELPSLRDPDFFHRFGVVCAIVTAVALAVALAVYLFKLVLLVVLGCVLSVLFTTIADPLARRLPGPRGLYVTLAFLVFLGGVAGLIALLVVPLANQAQELANEVPRIVSRLERVVDATTPDAVPAPAPRETASVKEAVTEKLPAVAATSVPWLVETLEGGFDILGAIFFGLFLALSPAAHRRGFGELFPARYRPRIDALLDDAHDTLRAWLGAVGIGMTIVFVLTTVGLYAIGIDDWLVFGAFSAGMELIPYAGPFLGFLGPFIAAFLNGAPRQVALVVLLYVGVQALMVNLISPYLVKRRTEIPASLAIASILLLGRACGAIGVIAAVPFVAIALAALRTLPGTTVPRFQAGVA